MKYQTGKLKTEHSFMKEFTKFLKLIEKISEVKRIIPGRINRQQKGTGNINITFSYFTESGIKYVMKKGGTAQELFVICSLESKSLVANSIENIINNQEFL